MTENNPYIEPENYYAGYDESIKNNAQNKAALSFDKMCFELFNSGVGKEFLSYCAERFVMRAFVAPGVNNAGESAMYYEGFKEAFRMMISAVNAHQQRITAGEANEPS